MQKLEAAQLDAAQPADERPGGRHACIQRQLQDRQGGRADVVEGNRRRTAEKGRAQVVARVAWDASGGGAWRRRAGWGSGSQAATSLRRGFRRAVVCRGSVQGSSSSSGLVGRASWPIDWVPLGAGPRPSGSSQTLPGTTEKDHGEPGRGAPTSCAKLRQCLLTDSRLAHALVVSVPPRRPTAAKTRARQSRWRPPQPPEQAPACA